MAKRTSNDKAITRTHTTRVEKSGGSVASTTVKKAGASRSVQSGAFVGPRRPQQSPGWTLRSVLARNGVDTSEADFLAHLDHSLASAGTGIAALSEHERRTLNRIAGRDPSAPGAEPSEPNALLARLAAERAATTYATTISTGQAAELLGIDRTNVTRRIGHRTLYAVRVAGNKFRLPRWQFRDDGRLLPGLDTVIAAIPERYPLVMLDAFLRTPNEACGGQSPIDYLTAHGNPQAVAALMAELDQW